jgi:hypothetical protein
MADLRGADFTGAADMNAIACVARTNIQGTIGLMAGDATMINAADDDDYRRAIAKSLNEGQAPCGFISIEGWSIDGPPGLRSNDIHPRSLRTFPVEWARELPGYLKKDISVFLDYVQKLKTADVQVAFSGLQAKLGFERTPDFEDVLVAGSPISKLEYVTLQGDPITCSETTRGFKLALNAVPDYYLHRGDFDRFIDQKVGTGEEFGTEEKWQLPQVGSITESAQNGEEVIVFATCSASPQSVQ